MLHSISSIYKSTLESELKHGEASKKNKHFFWLLFSMTACQPFIGYFGQMSSELNSIMFIWNFTNLFLFLILCRTYIWLFYIYFGLAASFVPVYILYIEKSFAIIYFGFCLGTPAFVYMITKNIWLMLITEIVQIATGLTMIKDGLKNLLLLEGHDAFLEKLINNNVATALFMLALFASMFIELEKKTKDLAQANIKAQEALEQQKTFVFSFSHELRNPINSLLGNLQLALMDIMSNETREMIKTAQICGELLLQMINNLLDAGKLNLGKIEVDLVSTEIHGLFQRIWMISNELITRKQLRSHLKFEKSVPLKLMVDSHRLTQIMMNLIGNAVKFTDAGSISITVQWLESKFVDDMCFEPIPYDIINEGLFEKEENMYMLRRNTGSNNYLVLSKSKKKFSLKELHPLPHKSEGVLKIIVADTGCGMDNNAINKLFQKFSQVSSDKHKRQIGTGLGLYITKEICKKMNGDVRVYSQPSVGTTFIVCIPAPVATDQDRLDRTPSAVIARLADKRIRAIIADDLPFNVNLICNYLSKFSAQVIHTASNGYEALEKYISSKESGIIVDVIILDVDMPKMDGITACQKIREYEKQHKLLPATIMLISGNYDEHKISPYLSSGEEKCADCFLKKPLSYEEFYSAVYRLKITS